MKKISNLGGRLKDWLAQTFPDSSSGQLTAGADLQTLEDRVLYSASPIPVDPGDAVVADMSDLFDTSGQDAFDQQFDFLAAAIDDVYQLDAGTGDLETTETGDGEPGSEDGDTNDVAFQSSGTGEDASADGTGTASTTEELQWVFDSQPLTSQSGDEVLVVARGGAAANQPPTSADTILHIDIGTEGTSDNRQPEASQNTQIQFSETDFAYEDAEHSADPGVDAFTELKIYSAPHFGELRHGGTLITQAVIDLQPDGYVVQIDQIDDLRFTAAAGESGIAQFGFRVNDGHDNSDLLYTMRLHVDVGPQVIISTDGDGPADANLPEFDDNHALSLGGPDLNLFPSDTRGDWNVAFEQQTGGSVDGLHFVTEDTLVAGSQLLTGDVLFSIRENSLTIDLKSFDGNDPGLTTVSDEDILVYRDNQGTIEYYRLVNLPGSIGDVVAFTLAESNTIIGDEFIGAGDLLYVTNAGEHKSDPAFTFRR